MQQPDFGSTFLLALVVFAMMFVSGLPFRYIGALSVAGIIAIGLAIWQTPYRLARVVSFFRSLGIGAVWWLSDYSKLSWLL